MPKLSQESLNLIRAATEAEREVGSARLATALEMLLDWHDRQDEAEAPKPSSPSSSASSRAAIDVLAARHRQIVEHEFVVTGREWNILAKAAYVHLGHAATNYEISSRLLRSTDGAAAVSPDIRREMVDAIALGLAAIEALDIATGSTKAVNA